MSIVIKDEEVLDDLRTSLPDTMENITTLESLIDTGKIVMVYSINSPLAFQEIKVLSIGTVAIGSRYVFPDGYKIIGFLCEDVNCNAGDLALEISYDGGTSWYPCQFQGAVIGEIQDKWTMLNQSIESDGSILSIINNDGANDMDDCYIAYQERA